MRPLFRCPLAGQGCGGETERNARQEEKGDRERPAARSLAAHRAGRRLRHGPLRAAAAIHFDRGANSSKFMASLGTTRDRVPDSESTIVSTRITAMTASDKRFHPASSFQNWNYLDAARREDSAKAASEKAAAAIMNPIMG